MPKIKFSGEKPASHALMILRTALRCMTLRRLNPQSRGRILPKRYFRNTLSSRSLENGKRSAIIGNKLITTLTKEAGKLFKGDVKSVAIFEKAWWIWRPYGQVETSIIIETRAVQYCQTRGAS